MYHANPYQYPIAFHFFRFSSFFFLLLKGPQKSSRIKKYIFLKFPIVLPVYLWYISFTITKVNGDCLCLKIGHSGEIPDKYLPPFRICVGNWYEKEGNYIV